ncbi:hypothetical protein ACFFGV_05350 [Pontibacillus salicampi]|uniref:Mas-related G-protein coupled receptor member D n=1 Tax=Pontibacillus salicampi TaxID=1449801 RepID=A0ABV6LL47_9BACI
MEAFFMVVAMAALGLSACIFLVNIVMYGVAEFKNKAYVSNKLALLLLFVYLVSFGGFLLVRNVY